MQTNDNQHPECPYDCPYDPNKQVRPENDTEVDETELTEESCPAIPDSMTAIFRNTDHESDIHFDEIWNTQYGPKVGVTSTRDHAEVFQEVEWDKAHHRWNSPRVDNTNMWELDLEALFYVAVKFFERGVDVTISDEVLKQYTNMEEGKDIKADNS